LIAKTAPTVRIPAKAASLLETVIPSVHPLNFFISIPNPYPVKEIIPLQIAQIIDKPRPFRYG
jgi:hypothetical protein